ncbi:CHRD domain-containing protein [Haladaptatus halobius]|uniref:CHRD domain-containing protein n=1 Tax=Haladaptatus halobius TaxID=2884875 RepID=UPI001D0B8C55|nr:CHRD domain-containing protein [Haladaptatus halobius]
MIDRRELLKIGAGAALGTGFVPGAVTAQQDRATFYVAALAGGLQVPPVETPAQGGALFGLSENGSEINYTLAVSDIRNVLMAHIHLGAPDENGEVVVWLYPSPEQQSPELKRGRFNGVLVEGTFTADDLVGPLSGDSLDVLVRELAQGDAYVNVHTRQNPDGEIRGQIHPVNKLVDIASS